MNSFRPPLSALRARGPCPSRLIQPGDEPDGEEPDEEEPPIADVAPVPVAPVPVLSIVEEPRKTYWADRATKRPVGRIHFIGPGVKGRVSCMPVAFVT